jgi:hypothetical protein
MLLHRFGVTEIDDVFDELTGIVNSIASLIDAFKAIERVDRS